MIRSTNSRRLLSLAAAGVLVVAVTAPAQAADETSGLELARDYASWAIDLASTIDDSTMPSSTEAPSGDAHNGNNGKSADAKGMGKGKAKDDPRGNTTNGNDADELTGRERADEAISKALERGNGNGNAFGRGHAAEVINKLLAGKSVATLHQDENHGTKVSAMVKAFNEIKAPSTKTASQSSAPPQPL